MKILANTIKKIETKDAVSFFMYAADHGENLFDTAENLVLHGGTKPSTCNIHVPLFVWSSAQYRKTYPQKWANTITNKDKKMSSNMLFYSILDVADITFPKQDLERAVTFDVLKEDSVQYMITPDGSVVKF